MTKTIKNDAVRKVRRLALQGVQKGMYSLRVVGTAKHGYQLAAERKNMIVSFGRMFLKQADAIDFGKNKFGQTARRVQAIAKAA